MVRGFCVSYASAAASNGFRSSGAIRVLGKKLREKKKVTYDRSLILLWINSATMHTHGARSALLTQGTACPGSYHRPPTAVLTELRLPVKLAGSNTVNLPAL